MHSEAPSSAAYLPEEHATQLDWPTVAVMDPAMQLVHELAVVAEYLPTLQSVQTDEPSLAAYLPLKELFLFYF
jgi:hypothetical protein